MKRIKIKSTRPNPLFESWLEEWMNEAASRNSDLKYHFSKALRSLKKYPLPLKSGKDCIILQHFGTKLCSMLDRKLKEYKVQSKDSTGANDYVCVNCNYNEQSDTSKRKFNKERQIAADCMQQQVSISKNYTRNLPDKVQSVESVAATKFNDQSEKHDEQCAKKKVKESNIDKKKEQEITRKTKTAKNNALNKAANEQEDLTNNIHKNIYIESDKFDVILLVDTQEISGGKTKPQHDATIVELTQLGVLFEVRHLKVGDFAWIARCKFTNNELVLPYIVERKRIDDLSASITDGRFHEQKFRLKQSGIENLMYVVEEYDKNYRLAIPHSSLMQASINSLVQDGFILKYTKSHKDSMFYLSSLTRILNQIYKGKNLIGCKKENLVETNILSDSVRLMEFEEFNKAASKQKAFKVSQMFVRQLLQLKGMSVDKALAIVERYPTPRILINALHDSVCNGELLLANIQFGDKKRMVGPAISKTVYQLYTKTALS